MYRSLQQTASLLTATACVLLVDVAGAQSAMVELDLPEQSLALSLNAVAAATHINVLFDTAEIAAYRAPALKGRIGVDEALSRLLAGTGLTHRFLDAKTIVLAAGGGETASQVPGASGELQARTADADTSADLDIRGIPEVLVSGSRILNMDVRRTQDDPQPYQILDSVQIERSGAVSVESFLKRGLTANTSVRSNGQINANANGNSSSVDLRGLGTASTLILINGRRAVGASAFGENIQPDLNSIPLAAIERIEVLPSAASAIYGGAAMGGMVNVILKQNYDGGEARVRYENTFEADAPIREVDLTYGTSFEDGRTNVLVAAHYSDSEWLVNGDRPELLSRGVARVLQNYPALLRSATNPFHVGTTPNIASVDGSALTLRDGTALGSSFTYIPSGFSAGSNPTALVANAGNYNLNLANVSNFRTGLARPLGSAPRVNSVMAVARRNMTDDLELFTEFSLSKNTARALFNPLFGNYVVPASAPTNPFQQAVRINIPDVANANRYETEFTSRRAVLGFIYDLPGSWKMESDYTWNSIDNRVRSGFINLAGALASGAVNPFVDTLAFPLDLSQYISGGDGPYFSSSSYLHDVGLRFVGQPGRLPAGQPTVTIGLGYRKEGMDAARERANYPAVPAGSFDNIYYPQSQHVYSAYAEGLIPLVSRANTVRGIHELDLQLAVRSEQYSVNSSTGVGTFGSTDEPERTRTRYTHTSGTAGLRYEIVEGLTVRTSFATAFLPPTYSQLLPGRLVTSGVVSIIDPRRGNTVTDVQVIQGGNSELEPQVTDNWNVGLVIEPAFAPGLRISADWFRFEQDNVIIDPTVLAIVNNESRFPSRITRAAVAPGDPYGVGQITIVDQSLINGTRAEIDGIDLGVLYSLPTAALGAFQFAANATVFQHYKVQDAIGSPLVDKVNEVANGGPLKFKANASLAWDLGPWSAGWSSYYFGSYDQYDVGTTIYVTAQGGETVPSQVYHDVFLAYRVPEAFGSRAGQILSGVNVQLAIKNLFDAAPPFDAFYQSPAYYSPFGDARMRSYSLTVSKEF
ncbi:TonB-dependent receptor [Steroidobacter sp.]|uniref:TonB-dependent receptor n=1 Tax=Steroidobacter sp. TaxID=1978227 RepID=UPI001A4BE67C|nr:TonB-dependent receptor [Steroidobacter sp.]MBL8270019.1 TonB-dependent receptor [Steroidobacter sp.]